MDVRHQAYVIDWLDHADGGYPHRAWHEIESLSIEPVPIRTVGFLVQETEKFIIVAHSTSGEECTAPFVIVRSAIVAMAPLALPELPKE